MWWEIRLRISVADAFGDAELGPQRAAHYVSQGFTAVKFDPVMPMSAFDPRQLSLEALDNAELVTKNIREAVGSKADLLIGTHGQMTTSSAIRLAKRLEPFDPLWFEEPVPPENMKEMGRVARSTSIPVATGERLATKYEFAELLEWQGAAILQPALGRVGGILEAKKIAGMAEAHYAELAPHLYCGPIEAAANIQIATCSPNFLIQESIERFDGFHAKLLKNPIQWEEGYIIPPTEPGLGVELDEPIEVAEIIYFGRTAMLRTECWKDYEVYLDVPYYGNTETAYPDAQSCRKVYPEKLDDVLAGVAKRRCAACHAQGRFPRRPWTRITEPQSNAFLMAPLAKTAGGRQSCGKPVFQDKDDPD